MRIDCERCPFRGDEARCEGCLVDFILELDEGADEEVVVVDGDLARAVRSLAEAGLLEPVRREREAG